MRCPSKAWLATAPGRPTGGRQNKGNALPGAITRRAAVTKSQARGGWTLIEMVVVLSILTLLLAVVTVMLRKIVQQDRAFGQHADQQRAFVRLAEHFRSDVHGAVRVERLPATPEDAVGTAFRCTRLDGQSVDYQLHRGRLLRTEPDAEGRATQQRFTVPEGTTVRLTQDSQDGLPVAVLEIEYPAGFAAQAGRTDLGARRRLAIAAAVGRDLRWLETAE